MPKGIIVKALSGYYYVLPENGTGLIQCRARGIFKKKGITPLVGDQVEFAAAGETEGTVTEIFPRRSELVRPPVANVDQAVLVFAVSEPELSLQLLDKFLVHIAQAGIDCVICFTKEDLLKQKDAGFRREMEDIWRLYADIGYPVVITSAAEKTGISRLQELLAGKISVFAGQSGVGKSSLLNALVPGLNLDTKQISVKLGRGKHTTRHVELISLSGDGFVADTPGFSQLDFQDMEPEDLAYCFKEFSKFAGGCKFRGCLHYREPGCQVIAAKERGEIAAARYEHYIFFLSELKEKRRRY
jgi:ribosome biogenesis GTPase